MAANAKRIKKSRTQIPEQDGPRALLSREQVIKIHARTFHDHRTIVRWAAGKAVEWNTAARIESACSAVGAEVLA